MRRKTKIERLKPVARAVQPFRLPRDGGTHIHRIALGYKEMLRVEGVREAGEIEKSGNDQ